MSFLILTHWFNEQMLTHISMFQSPHIIGTVPTHESHVAKSLQRCDHKLLQLGSTKSQNEHLPWHSCHCHAFNCSHSKAVPDFGRICMAFACTECAQLHCYWKRNPFLFGSQKEDCVEYMLFIINNPAQVWPKEVSPMRYTGRFHFIYNHAYSITPSFAEPYEFFCSPFFHHATPALSNMLNSAISIRLQHTLTIVCKWILPFDSVKPSCKAHWKRII